MKTFSCLSVRISGVSIAILLQGCPGPDLVNNIPGGYIDGTYQWDSTTTPGHVYTPKSVGYSQQIKVVRGNYDPTLYSNVSFYRNDTLQRRVFEATGDSAKLINLAELSVLVKYVMSESGSLPSTYLKYTVQDINADKILIVSEFMSYYSEKADTVHHYYHFPRVPLSSLYPN